MTGSAVGCFDLASPGCHRLPRPLWRSAGSLTGGGWQPAIPRTDIETDRSVRINGSYTASRRTASGGAALIRDGLSDSQKHNNTGVFRLDESAQIATDW